MFNDKADRAHADDDKATAGWSDAAIAAAVQDDHADPILLAKIAYEHPQFGAEVALNPRAYPGLKRWLAQFGDERARRLLAGMGYSASPDPVRAREADVHESVVRKSVVHESDAKRTIATPAGATQSGNGPTATEHPAHQTRATVHNPYGFTAEQALDPNTDQLTIARIAQYAPELRPCLARNPNTYPALVDWLAQLHDPAVDAALASRSAMHAGPEATGFNVPGLGSPDSH